MPVRYGVSAFVKATPYRSAGRKRRTANAKNPDAPGHAQTQRIEYLRSYEHEPAETRAGPNSDRFLLEADNYGKSPSAGIKAEAS